MIHALTYKDNSNGSGHGYPVLLYGGGHSLRCAIWWLCGTLCCRAATSHVETMAPALEDTLEHRSSRYQMSYYTISSSQSLISQFMTAIDESSKLAV